MPHKGQHCPCVTRNVPWSSRVPVVDHPPHGLVGNKHLVRWLLAQRAHVVLDEPSGGVGGVGGGGGGEW
jgi:hypothetical protein